MSAIIMSQNSPSFLENEEQVVIVRRNLIHLSVPRHRLRSGRAHVRSRSKTRK